MIKNIAYECVYLDNVPNVDSHFAVLAFGGLTASGRDRLYTLMKNADFRGMFTVNYVAPSHISDYVDIINPDNEHLMLYYIIADKNKCRLKSVFISSIHRLCLELDAELRTGV